VSSATTNAPSHDDGRVCTAMPALRQVWVRDQDRLVRRQSRDHARTARFSGSVEAVFGSSSSRTGGSCRNGPASPRAAIAFRKGADALVADSPRFARRVGKSPARLRPCALRPYHGARRGHESQESRRVMSFVTSGGAFRQVSQAHAGPTACLSGWIFRRSGPSAASGSRHTGDQWRIVVDLPARFRPKGIRAAGSLLEPEETPAHACFCAQMIFPAS